jgi:hypothetical protein
MKTPKQLNLISAFAFKEKVFWKRTWGMTKRSWAAFIIAIPFITLGHYAFALMHLGFETTLWIFRSPQFEVNLQRMVKVSA